ncbi:MAG: hydantoinase/carbamoylase family amidase [Ectothiorhodospiraceae bacterium]|nr:hydantoinase/carbamoylase family amidase [Chromatiales bacterium]MCP5154513.1 hydantoinase/carbamoylase family amidase [Ectothiorhodospiraceae bacterium]
MARIDGDRLLADLRALRAFGATGTGVVRPSLSEVDMRSRHWLVERLAAAGLDAGIDGLGTVYGRARKTRDVLLLGSHTDTQPTGGWLDGALGVIYGLEVARALGADPATRDLGVDVASWIDEEGTYRGWIGSLGFVGQLPDEWVETATDASGKRFTEALRDAGLAGRPRFTLDPSRYRGYVEAHIEQGPWLEEEGKRIGVVTGIVGIRQMRIRAVGQQNHAGTTPMARRRDAGRALVALAHAIHTAFPDHVGPRTVWTIGWMRFEPGAPSIVPGVATMNLQFRDVDEAILDRLEALARELVAKAGGDGVEVSIESPAATAGAMMDETLRAHLERAAEAHAPGAWMPMPSGAGHDAQVLARRLPSAMLFIPSIGGISHSFDENTGDDDIVLGCQVLADAVVSILGA